MIFTNANADYREEEQRIVAALIEWSIARVLGRKPAEIRTGMLTTVMAQGLLQAAVDSVPVHLGTLQALRNRGLLTVQDGKWGWQVASVGQDALDAAGAHDWIISSRRLEVRSELHRVHNLLSHTAALSIDRARRLAGDAEDPALVESICQAQLALRQADRVYDLLLHGGLTSTGTTSV